MAGHRAEGVVVSNQQEQIREFLESPVWPENLVDREFYTRLHDDHDGTREGTLHVMFGCDGDAYISIHDAPPFGALRFRTFSGGGKSLRTRAALLLLAEAIRLDNEEYPQGV